MSSSSSLISVFTRFVLGAGISLTASSAGLAHLEPTAGRFPFVENGQLIGGGTTWGLVLDQQGSSAQNPNANPISTNPQAPWIRVCEEASQFPFFFYRRDDGVVLVGTPQGLFFTDDAGCRYQPDALFGTTPVSAYWVSLRDSQKLWATTAAIGLQAGAVPIENNTVILSNNGGRSWQASNLHTLAGQLLFSIAGSEDGQILGVAGLDTNTQRPFVYASLDFGNSWYVPAVSLQNQNVVRMLGTDTDGRALLLSTVDANGIAHLWRSGNGLSTIDEIANFPSEVTHAAAFQGKRYVVTADGRSWSQTNPAATPAVFEVIPNGPTKCLQKLPNDPSHLWGCGAIENAGHFYRSTDGVVWETLMPFDAVGERLCPDDTAGAIACAPYLSTLDAGVPDAGITDAGALDDAGSDAGGSVDADAGNTTPPPPDGGVHCQQSAPVLPLGAGILLGLLRLGAVLSSALRRYRR